MSWDEITNVKMPLLAVQKPGEVERGLACVTVLVGSARGEMFKINGARAVIGRGQTADFRILDDGISREHCELLVEGDQIILHDLGSTNGTFCRGVRVGRQALVDGDKILVGTGTVLKFAYNDKLDETFQRQMFESALRDDLTKTFNKRYFIDRIESEFAYAVRHHIPLALASLDIDHFKAINDTHGHPAGDHVLAEMSAVVLATVRVEDVVARVGGEEFGIVCRDADIVQGTIVGERVRCAIANRQFTFGGKIIPVAVSVGVAAVPSPSIKNPKDFIAATDQALYEAKRNGRNRVYPLRQ